MGLCFRGSVLLGGKGYVVGRKILMGCGALSILGVLGMVAVGCLAVLGSSGSDTADSSVEGNEAAQDSGGSEAAPAATLGEPVDVGEVEWVVTNARRVTQLQSSFDEPKQGNFVVLDFTFTNTGSEALTLDSESLVLKDAANRTFEADPETFGYIEPDKDVFLEQVNPGVTREGEVIFTIPEDVAQLQAELGDAELFTDEVGYVNLGI